MSTRRITLPKLEDLPQEICRLCNRSLICGLFMPAELATGSNRCRKCCGEISESNRRKNQSQYMPKLSINSPHA